MIKRQIYVHFATPLRTPAPSLTDVRMPPDE